MFVYFFVEKNFQISELLLNRKTPHHRHHRTDSALAKTIKAQMHMNVLKTNAHTMQMEETRSMNGSKFLP